MKSANLPPGFVHLSLAIDPLTPETLYLGAMGFSLLKSINGGDTWAPSNTGLGVHAAMSIAIDPEEPSTLYAGTMSGGVYKSEDSGATWTSASAMLNGKSIRSLAIDAKKTSTLYAGSDSSGVYMSLDAGATWQDINNGLEANANITTILIEPKNSANLYIGTIDHGAFKAKLEVVDPDSDPDPDPDPDPEAFVINFPIVLRDEK